MSGTTMRQQVLREIVASEQSYVEDLERLVLFFVSPLRRLAGGDSPVLSTGQLAAIFGSVDQLLDFNKSLLSQLREAQDAAATPGDACIGRIFRDFGPYLKMYSAYVDKHADALKALDDAEAESASFRAFLTNIYALNTVRGQTLRSFLIMPVQRVPRYRLLLKELRKHTPDGHADAAELDGALQQVETAATHINEGIRRRENMEKILEIQDAEGVSVVAPGRVFLKEGPLNKLCRRGFKPFKFYLFNDLLLYCGAGQFGRSNRSIPLKSVTTADTGATTVKKSARGSFFVGASSSSGSAGGGGSVPAGGVYAYADRVAGDRVSAASHGSREGGVGGADDDDDEPQMIPRGGVPSTSRGPSDSAAASTKEVDPAKSFMLKSSTKSFIVQAPSPDEAAAWRSAIMGAAVQCRRGAAGGGAAEASSAPVWEVDSEVNDCRLCGLRFSLISRKHHCRHCGSIVCGPCSPYRWPLPTIDPDKPARVCTQCYAGLAGGGAPAPPSPDAGANSSLKNLGRRLSVGLKDVATRIRNSSLGSNAAADDASPGAAPGEVAVPPAAAAGGGAQLEDDYVPDRRRSVPRRKPSATPADGYLDIDAAVEGAGVGGARQPPPLPPRNEGPPPVPARPSAQQEPVGGAQRQTPPPIPARPAPERADPAVASHRRRSSSVHRADFDRVAFEPVKQAVTPRSKGAAAGSSAAAPAPAPAARGAAAAAAEPADDGVSEVQGAGPNVFLEEHPPVRPTDEASLPTSFLYGCVVAGDFDVEGLPENWFAAGDEGSARVYYFNDVTEETTWAPPPGSDPTLVATTVVRLPKEWTPRRTPDGRLFFVKQVQLPRGAPATHGFKSQWALPVGSTKLRSFETKEDEGGSTETDDVVSRVGAIGVRIIKDITGSTSHGDVAGNFSPQRQAVGVQVLGGGSADTGGYQVDYHADAGTASLLESNTSLEQYKQNKAKREKRLSELHMQVAASGQSAPEANKTSKPLASMLTGGGKAPAPAPRAANPAPVAEAVHRSTPPVPPPRSTPSARAGAGPVAGTDDRMAEEVRKLQDLEQSHTAPSGRVNVRAMLGQFGGQRSARVKRASGAGIGSPPQIALPTENAAAPTLAKSTAGGGGASSGPISSHKRPSWMVARHGGGGSAARGGGTSSAPAPAPAPAAGVASRAKRLSAISSKFGGGAGASEGPSKGPRRSSAVPRIGEGSPSGAGGGGSGTRNAAGKRVSALLAKFEGKG